METDNKDFKKRDREDKEDISNFKKVKSIYNFRL